MKSLSDSQRAQAIIGETAPRDVLTSADQQAEMQEDIGIAYKDLSADQQGVVISLLEELARIQAPAVAAERLANVRKKETIEYNCCV